MTLTRSFKETLQARVQRDAAFRIALLMECVEAFLADDIDLGEAVLGELQKQSGVQLHAQTSKA